MKALGIILIIYCIYRIFRKISNISPDQSQTSTQRNPVSMETITFNAYPSVKIEHSPAYEYDLETGEVFDYHDRSSLKDKYLQKWRDGLITIWNGSEQIEFTYSSASGRIRRKVTMHEIQIGGSGKIYLKGFCHYRNETRTFNTRSIQTKILFEGKRYDIKEFLTKFVGASNKQ